MKYKRVSKKGIFNRLVCTTFDIAEKMKIPRSNIQQYIDRGFIKASIEQAKGKGSRNLFSLEDLYRIRTFQKLHEAGLPQRDASEKSRNISYSRIKRNNGLNVAYLTFEDGESKIHQINEKDLSSKLFSNYWNILIFINLLKIKTDVDELMKD